MVRVRVVYEDADEGTTWAGYDSIRVEDGDGVIFEANVADGALEEVLEEVGGRVLEDLAEDFLEEVADG